jgi:primosomal protein N'
MFLYDILLPLGLNQVFTYQSNQSIALGQWVQVPFRQSLKWGLVWRQTVQKNPLDLSCPPKKSEQPFHNNFNNNQSFHGSFKTIEKLYNVPAAGKDFLDFLAFVHQYTLIPLGQLLKMALPLKDLDPLMVALMTYEWVKPPHLKSDLCSKIKTPSDPSDSQSVRKTQKKHIPALPPIHQLSSTVLKRHLKNEKINICGSLWDGQPFLGSRDMLEKNVDSEDSEGKSGDSHGRKTLKLSQQQQNAQNLLWDYMSLSSDQQKGWQETSKQSTATKHPNASDFQVILLEGLTGSGKTEVYLSLLPKLLQERQQVLLLVPEVSLIRPLAQRIINYFAKEPLIWHGSLPSGKRKEVLTQVLSGKSLVLVGTRSSIFLPYRNLRGIIVDEEHDPSYKQSDPPCYQGRDMAIARGQKARCSVILSSATPSFETLRNVALGRYKHVRLDQRYGKALLPDIHIIDRKKFPLKPRQWITQPLRTKLQETFEKGQQSLVFYNRRGYAPVYICPKCGDRPMCHQCAHWLTLHLKRDSKGKALRPQETKKGEAPILSQTTTGLHNPHHVQSSHDRYPHDLGPNSKYCLSSKDHHTHPETDQLAQLTSQITDCSKTYQERSQDFRLQCHYCGFSKEAPTVCESCHSSTSFIPWGVGVEALEEEVRSFLPQARIGICSSDLLSSSKDIDAFIRSVLAQEIQVIVGTQMISKGHHFPHLTCVGIVEADDIENPLDPRSCERLYQTITQVAGRSGRESLKGQVYIQTHHPQSSWIQGLQHQDMTLFFQEELAKRAQVGFSPFARWAMVTLKGPNEMIVQENAKKMALAQPKHPQILCLGPAPAPMNPLRGLYRWRFLVKAPLNLSIQNYIQQWLERLATKNKDLVEKDSLHNPFKKNRAINPITLWGLSIDIDPYDFL